MTKAAKAAVRTGTATATAFGGFDRKAMQFWHELAAEMNREWFLENKERYETQWLRPMTALLAGASARLAPAYRGVKLGAPRVMRINRDIRFSKDKSPYKTWIGGGVSLGERKPNEGVTALYVHFGVDAEFSGAGQYVFVGDTLTRWRRKLDDKVKGPEIAKIVAGLRKAKYQVTAYDELVRVPRPYAADHPRADLLRMKGLVIGFPAIPRGLIHRPELVGWLVGHAKAAAPLATWLYRNLR
ncbi:MAG TPA: TIGR02453 family protein [Kofleriaceae bacterium]|nr:TIGR02453 family protein [Kofleriaceae bacterium]